MGFAVSPADHNRVLFSDSDFWGSSAGDIQLSVDGGNTFKPVNGPWQAGAPSQGYQLPFTPAELYRTALGAINSELKTKTPFAQMPAAEQDAYLHGLESGGKNLGGVPSNVFFATLWECTVEGFFSDPVYGGNRGMVAWRMIGFPGAYESYYDLVDQHGIKFDQPPTSLAEDVHGHVHADADIPARLP